MIRSLRILKLSFLLLLYFIDGVSQTLPPPITIYGSDDFIAHHQVFCAEALPDGRTAFGGGDGVFFYHGEGFDHVPREYWNSTFSMDIDSSSRLFVGGRSLMGVVVPDSLGTPSFHSLIPHLPDSLQDFGIIWGTVCTPGGDVYFNAQDHLFRYDGDTVTVLHPEKQFYGLHLVSEGVVTQDVDSGLFRIKGTEKVHLPGSGELTRDKDIMAVLPMAGELEGTWAVFSRAKGIYGYDPHTGEHSLFKGVGEEEEDFLKEIRRAKIYTACRLDPKKNPYGAAYVVGTMLNGLYLLSPEGRIVLHLDADSGLPADMVWEVVPDFRGNVWAATDDGIALLHTAIPFTIAGKGTLFKGGVTDLSRPLLSREAKRSLRSPLYLATLQGTWKWRKDENAFSLLEGTASQCLDLLSYGTEGQNPRILVAGGNAGLLSLPIPFDPGGILERADTIIRENSYSLASLPFPGNNGSILHGGWGTEGLQILVPSDGPEDEWKELLTVRDLPEEVRTMGWDTSGTSPDSIRLWGGLPSKGVLSVTIDTAFTGYRSTRYDTTHGLPKGPVMIFSSPSQAGSYVVVGTQEGLFRFERGRFVPDPRFGETFANGSRHVTDLVSGMDDEVWIDDQTGGRIKHLLPQEDGSFRIDSTVFRFLELGAVRAFLPEKDRTWIGGDRGLACYFPEVEKDLEEEWHCLLREVKGSGDSLLFRGTFSKKAESGQRAIGEGELSRIPIEEQPERMVPRLRYSQNRVVFKYSAPYPDRQEAVKYSFKLSGFDTSWSEWTDRVRKEYTNLPERSYTFKVKAENVYGRESTTAEYRFQVLPPWYRTSLAYAGYGTTGALTLALIAWLAVRKRNADRRAKEYLEGLEKANVEIRQQKDTIEEAHEEITDSINYAQNIQNTILPTKEELDRLFAVEDDGDPPYFILFKPQHIVSGDFYWTGEREDSILCCAADCTGHGVPGAFVSLISSRALDDALYEKELALPGEILDQAKRFIIDAMARGEGQQKDGMDAAILRIANSNSNSNSNSKEEGEELAVGNGQLASVEVQFAGANNPLYIIREGIAEELEDLKVKMYRNGEPVAVEEERIKPFRKSPNGFEIKGDPMAVGYEEEKKGHFTTVELQLRPGDLLYTFSDGYADQFGGPKNKKFRYGPFKELLEKAHRKPMEEQRAVLDKEFEDWKGEQEQVDDVVVIGVRL